MLGYTLGDRIYSVKTLAALFLILSVFLPSSSSRATVISCGSGASCVTTAAGVSATGVFAATQDVFVEQLTLAASAAVMVQTYGFGGGPNAAGAVIPSGGFDSLVALFSGPPTSASILMSGGNPIASSPATTQFFPGCPPAGTAPVVSESICGDNKLSANLAAGSYTLLLSDARYIPLAVSPGDPTPQDLTSAGSYADFTAGVFQTCNERGECIITNGDFAVDLLFATSGAIPEPGTMLLLGSGLAALVWQRKRRNRGCPSDS